MPFKSEKQRKWMHINKPEMAKDWEKKLAYSDKKEKKMKREQKVKELIKKMVREELIEVTQNMEMRKNFPGFNGNEYAVIDNWIDMNSLSKTIAMFKKHKKSFSQFVKDAAKARMFETTKRDYKAEYKKFQSSDKSKKYRAELNKYNRQKGTYGNGDGKDASHKGGKIVGFEKESVNRGRAEKSRLKKEEKLKEVRIPFSSSHIKQLKRAFKDMKGTLPDNNPLVQQIVTLLKKTDKKVLKQIASADIKYLSDKAKDILGEGTCGYGENGELGEEPAGPHLIKKKLKEAKETIFDVAARVMKDKQAHGYKTKKGLVTVDMQTANLLMQVFKKVNPKMKKILSDIGYKSPTQLMNTLWAVVK